MAVWVTGSFSLAVTSCVLSLILFGIDLDARRLGEETGYYVTRSWSFYLLVSSKLSLLGRLSSTEARSGK